MGQNETSPLYLGHKENTVAPKKLNVKGSISEGRWGTYLKEREELPSLQKSVASVNLFTIRKKESGRGGVYQQLKIRKMLLGNSGSRGEPSPLQHSSPQQYCNWRWRHPVLWAQCHVVFGLNIGGFKVCSWPTSFLTVHSFPRHSHPVKTGRTRGAGVEASKAERQRTDCQLFSWGYSCHAPPLPGHTAPYV